MTAYAYRAACRQGRIQKGVLSAPCEAALQTALAAQGLELIEARAKSAFSLTLPALGMQKTESLRAKRLLCLHLGALLKAGADFAAALRTLLESLPQGSVRAALLQIEKDVQAGLSVQKAFAAHPALFDPVFLALLAAGEASGDLPCAFERLAQHLERQAALRATFLRAVRYPLFLLLVALGVTTFMLTQVVPEIVAFLTENGMELPLSTRLLLGFAQIALWVGGLLPFALMLLLAAPLGRKLWGEAGTRLADGLALRVPLWGALLRKIALARLTGSLSLLLQSGLPLATALQTASPALKNAALQEEAAQAYEALLGGAPFSQAAQALFPPTQRHMLRIGETGGALPLLLAEIAKQSESEAHEALRSFLAALEPALTLLVGGLLIWIVLAVLGPVYTSLGTFSAGG